MKQVPLTNSDLVALVDDEDYERVSQYPWHLFKKKGVPDRVQGGVKTEQGWRTTFLHRFILDAKPGQIVDHVNHSGFDNRRSNLRFCTLAENQHNRRKLKKGGSRYKGVQHRNQYDSWRARITIGGVRLHLGDFRSEIDAALAYDRAAREHFGIFAHFNFTEGDLTHGIV